MISSLLLVSSRRALRALCATLGFLTALVTSAQVDLAALRVDPNFNLAVESETGGAINAIADLGNGKVLVAGDFIRVNGNGAIRRLARFDVATGTLDNDFAPQINGPVNAIAIQPDGKIVIGGSFTQVGTTPRNNVARLTAEGDPDLLFNIGSGANSTVNAVALQTVGSETKILVAGGFSQFNGTGTGRNRLVRLNADGSVDGTFNASVTSSSSLLALCVQPDGKVLVGGSFTGIGGATVSNFSRLNANGTIDTDFNHTGSTPNAGVTGGAINAIALDTTVTPHRILIGGTTTSSYNGASSTCLQRLTSSGAVDPFTGAGSGSQYGPNNTVRSIVLDNASPRRILLGGNFTGYGATTAGIGRIVRIAADTGARDTAFIAPANDVVNAISVPTGVAGNPVVYGGGFSSINNQWVRLIAKVLDTAVRDAAFAHTFRAPGTITAIKPVAGGKIVVAGNFNAIGGARANHLARLNSDFTVDATFNDGRGSGYTADPSVVIAAPAAGTTATASATVSDGKVTGITIVNPGSGYQSAPAVTISGGGGTGALAFATLNATGGVASITVGGPGPSLQLSSLEVQADGKLVIGGGFTSYNGVTANRFARLTSDGALDFAYGTGAANGVVNAIIAETGGSIVIGGNFSTVNAAAAPNLARVSATGSVTALGGVLSGGNPSTVNAIAIQPSDGKIVFGGNFTSVGGVTRNHLARVDGTTGALDSATDFAVGTGPGSPVRAVAIDSNNKILVGGEFTAFNGTASVNRYARLATTGALEVSGAANSNVFGLVPLSEGRTLLYGTFSNFVSGNPVNTNTLARLGADGAIDLSFGVHALTFSDPANSGAVLPLADGSILLGGRNFTGSGRERSGLIRLIAAPAPAIASLSTTSVRPGASVTIAGSNFVDVTAVRYNGPGGVAAGSTTITPTSITANVPLGAASGPVVVQSLYGNGVAPTNLAIAPDFRLRNPTTVASSLEAGMVFGKGLYVAASTGGGILSSPNGIDWTQRYFSTTGLRDIAFGGDLFVAVGSAGTLLTSSDGINWTPRNAGTTTTLTGVTYSGSKWVIVTGGTTVVTSTNGTTWTAATSTGGGVAEDVEFGADLFVACGPGGVIRTSSDGLTWNTRVSNATNDLTSVSFLNNLFVAVGGGGTIVTSPDGIVWNARSSSVTNDLIGAAYGDGRFIVGYSGVGCVTSTNGVTWSNQPFPEGSIRVAVFANNQFVAGGNNGNVWTSPNGTEWTRRASITGRNLRDVAYGNGRFVAVSNFAGAGFATSTDGVDWTAGSGAAGATGTFNGVGYGGGLFVGVGPGLIATTADGVNWTARTPSGSFTLNHVAWGNGVWVAVGNTGVAYRSTDAVTWSPVSTGTSSTLNNVSFAGGQFVAVGASGTILTSPNGLTWSPQTSGSTATLNAVRHLGGTWYAVGSNSTVLTSANGTLWSAGTFPVAALTLTGIAQGDGFYVAIAANSTSFYLSLDGATWVQTAPGSDVFNTSGTPGIAFGNGRFAVVANNGLIFSSTPSADTVLIASQPAGTTFTSGQPVTLNVSATAATGYQWYQGLTGDTSFPVGTNSPSFSTLPLTASTRYWVRVTGAGGVAVDSATANLIGPPGVVVQPKSQSITEGTSVTFSVEALGAGTLSYQWRKGTTNIEGATGSSYSINAVTPSSAGDYNVVVTSSAGGSITSANATLSVTAAPPVLAQQANLGLGSIVQTTSTLDLQMNVTGTAPVTVQWKKDGMNLGAPVSPDAGNVAHFYIPSVRMSDAGVYTAIGANSAGSSAEVRTNNAQFIVDEAGWFWRHPRARFTRAFVADGNFLTVGGRGFRSTSPDGVVWTQQPSLASPSLAFYAFGNGVHVILGGAYVVTSTDGQKWTSGFTGVWDFPNRLVFGNGQFALSFADGRILASTDGRTWTARPHALTGTDFGLTFGGGTFVLGNGTSIYRSADLVTWSAPVPTPLTQVTALKYVQGKFFLATETGALASSPDLATWTTLTTHVTTALLDIEYANNRYVIVGDGGTILTSENGVDWQTRTSNTSNNLATIVYANNTWLAGGESSNTIVTSTDQGATWVNQNIQITTRQLNGIATNGTSHLVVVGNGANTTSAGTILRSTNGTDWAAVTHATTNHLNDIVYDGSTYIAVGGGGRILTSPTGETWASISSGTTNTLQFVGKLNDTLYAAGASGTLLTSTTGASWNIVTSGTTAQLNGMAAGTVSGQPVTIAVGNSGTIRYTTNGTWTGVTPVTSNHLNRVAFGNGAFVAVGVNGTILRSTNGTAWTSTSPAPSPENYYTVQFLNGAFIVGGLNGGVLVSSDGTQWFARNTGNAGFEHRGFAIFNNQIFAVGDGAAILSTALAPTIVQQPADTVAAIGGTLELRALVGGTMLPVTYQWRKGTTNLVDGGDISGATTGILRIANIESADAGSYNVVITPQGGAPITSATATVTTGTPPAITTQPFALANVITGTVNVTATVTGTSLSRQWYRGNKGDTSSPVSTSSTYTTPPLTQSERYWLRVSNALGTADSEAIDVLAFAPFNSPLLANTINGVAYGKDLYVAVASGNTIVVSANGQEWERVQGLSGNALRAVAFDGTRFVAVGDNGTIRVSQNGRTWTAATTPTSNTNQLLGVCHDGHRFVAVGLNSTLLTSTDGDVWTAQTGITPTNLALRAVAAGAGKLVVATGNGLVYTSPTDATAGGVTWTAATGFTTTAQLNAIAYAKVGTADTFVVVGNIGTVIASTDGGVSWALAPLGGTPAATSNLSSVTFGNGKFIAAGTGFFTSTNGTTWSSSNNFALNSGATMTSGVYADGRFVFGGFGGAVWTSASGDAGTWSLQNSALTLSVQDFAYGNGRYVGVASNGAIVTWNSDGTSPLLQLQAAGNASTLRRVIHAHGLFVAVGDSGRILASVDGATWVNRTFGTAAYTALTYGNNLFVAAGANGAYATSPDGLNWSAGTGTIGTANVTSLAFGLDRFAAVNGSGQIFTSSTGTSDWTPQVSPTTEALSRIIASPAGFVAVGNASTVVTAANGTTWTRQPMPTGTPVNLGLTDVSYGAGLYLAVHSGASGTSTSQFLVSRDAITWHAPTAGSSVAQGSGARVIFANGGFLVGGVSGQIVRLVPNANTPAINVQPPRTPVLPVDGSGTTLAVAAQGANLTYQWYRGYSGDVSQPIASATGASLPVTLSARYWGRVTAGDGTVLDSATSEVFAPFPVIATQPAHVQATLGQSAALSVTATGVGPLTYQWRKYGHPVAGATAATFPITALDHAGFYDVVVTDGLSSVTSQSAQVAVVPASFAAGTLRARPSFLPRVELGGAGVLAFGRDEARGWIYIAGEFTRINGTPRVGLARFNAATGQLDADYAPPAFAGGAVRALHVQPDGRVIVGGDFLAVGGVARGRLARLNTDGSVDASFVAGTGFNGPVFALQAHGSKLLVGGAFSAFNSSTTNAGRLARLLLDGVNDGAIDPAFTLGVSFPSDVRALAAQADGRIVAGGTFTNVSNNTSYSRLVRLNANGGLDDSLTFSSGFSSTVNAIALQTIGSEQRIVVGGNFSQLNGATVNRLVRLLPNGAVDPDFVTSSGSNIGFNNEVLSLLVDADNKLLVGGSFTSYKGSSTNASRLVRIDATGALDAATAFDSGTAFNGNVSALALQGTQLLVGGSFTSYNNTARDGIARLSTAGALDATLTVESARRPGSVFAIEPTADGKWLVGGNFNFIDDAPRQHLARFNADGSLDTWAMPANAAFNAQVNSLAVYADGRIVAGGAFTTVGATNRSRLARLNTDGALDPTFVPSVSLNNWVNAVALQPDGRIVAGGFFTDTGRVRIARFFGNGTADTAFNTATGTGFNSDVRALLVQADGKIVVGGAFATYNGTTVNSLTRLNADGTRDSGFNATGSGFNTGQTVFSVTESFAPQAVDRRLFATGTFSTYNGVTSNRVVRIDPTGAPAALSALGTGFTSTVTALALQPDGKLVAAGFFGSVNGTTRPLFARLAADGALESTLTLPSLVPTLPSNINVLRFAPDGGLLFGATRMDFAEALGRGALGVLEPAPLPTISTQPQTIAADGTQPVTFTVVATASGPQPSLQYQWFFEGEPIAGATSANYTIATPTILNVGDYQVRVFNPWGSVLSDTVELVGNNPLPVVTTQPAPYTAIVAGQSGSLTVASQGPGLTYLWTRNDELIPGATSATLTLNNATLDASGFYVGYVINGLVATPSQVARVEVTPSSYANSLRPHPTFNARVEGAAGIGSFAVLPDGRFYAVGSFTSVGGATRYGVARFLATGALDTEWTPAPVIGNVATIALQPDGKVLLGGSMGYTDNTNTTRIVRLNADGSLDTSFQVGAGFSGGNVAMLAVTGSGTDLKIYAVGPFLSYNARTASRIVRLNHDGTFDPTFATGAGFDGTVFALALDGEKVVAAGAFTRYNGNPAPRIARLLADGSLDPDFKPGTGFDNDVHIVTVRGTQILAGGRFANYNGAPAATLALLGADGARDAAFNPGTGLSAGTAQLFVNAIVSQGDKLLVAGNYTTYNGVSAVRVIRIDGATAALDTAFNSAVGTGPNSNIGNIALQTEGTTERILLGGQFTAVNGQPRSTLARLELSGALDSTVTTPVRSPGTVFAIAPVSGGKFILGGAFTHINGTPAGNIARVDADGTLDPTFATGTGFNNAVRAIVVQGTGDIVVGGQFTTYNGSSSSTGRVARLSPSGVLDPTFVGSFNNTVNTLALQPDGSIVAGGLFTSVTGVVFTGESSSSGTITANRIARFYDEGGIDGDFANAVGTGLNGTVNTVVVRADGKLVVGGQFTSFNGGATGSLVQLEPSGARDTAFAANAGTGFANIFGTATVNALALQPDGKLVVGGTFTSYNSAPQNSIARLDASGRLDFGFSTGDGLLPSTGTPSSAADVTAVHVQGDGKIVAAGNFQVANLHRRGGLARFYADGRLDWTFGVPFGIAVPASTINVLLPLPDGTLFAGAGRLEFRARITGALTRFESGPTLAILSHPFGGVLGAGTVSGLHVVATGAEPLTYQWRRDGVDVVNQIGRFSGSKTSALTFQSPQADDAGVYTVVVSDASGSVTSIPLPVSIVPAAPVITAEVQSTLGQVVQTGSVVPLQFTATGSRPVTVQWTKDSADLAGGSINADVFAQPLNGVTLNDAGIYAATLTHATLGSASTRASRIFVNEEPGWKFHHPLPTNQPLTTLAVINGQFHVGGVRGVRLTSPDGATWTTLPALSQNNVIDYAFGLGRHVLLGSLGYIAQSTDGVKWQSGSIGTGEPTQALAFGNGAFVTTTTSSGSHALAGKIYRSTDAATWQETFSSTAAGINYVAFGNNTFVAINNVGQVLRSTDGADWQPGGTVPGSGTVNFLRFVNGRFFTGGPDGQLLSSADGLGWTGHAVPTRYTVRNIAFAAGRYVLAGDSGTLFTSPDLTDWTLRTTGTPFDLREIAHLNGTWVVVSNQTIPVVILRSTDNGVTWTNQVTSLTPPGVNLNGLVSDGDSLIALGTAGTILRTTNGTDWSAVPSGITFSTNEGVFAGNRYLTVGSSGRVRQSTDGGLTWSDVATVSSSNLRSIAVLNNVYVATGDAGVIVTSADGNSWAPANSGTAARLNGATFGEGLYVAVGEAGTIVTSSNAVDWTPTTSPVSAALLDVAYGAGLFVAAGVDGALLTSEDGLAWVDRSMNAIEDYDSLVFTGTHFFLTGGFNAVYSSTDGLTWSGRHLGQSNDLTDVLPFNGRLYGVGPNATIMSAPLAPEILEQPTPETVLAGQPVTLRVLGGGSPVPVSYQWFHDGNTLEGQTRATLTLPATTAANAGNYTVRLSTTSGTPVTSNVAAVTVESAPVIIQPPVDVAVDFGANVTLSVVATGVPAPAYAWTLGDSTTVLGTAPSLTVTAVDLTKAGTYKVTVTNTRGSTSATVNVSLNAAILSLTPSNATVGDTVTIDGLGFTGATAVAINGVPVSAFTVVSNTRITATVPTFATTGRVTVVTGSGATLTSASDLTIASGPRLMHLAFRGSVGTGEDALLASFTVDDNSASPILVRAIGPGLVALGVANTLADPQLTIHDARGTVVASNDNWGGTAALINATESAGAMALAAASKDAALLLELPAGTYTARVTGVGDTTGEALLEVHNVATAGRIAHLSSRGRIVATATTGFVVGGGTGNKTVLVRALGSGLGTAGSLANPTLTVLSGATTLATNDNAASSPELAAATAAVGAMPLAANDSALLLTLPPGSYTAQVTGGAGIVQTEVFVIDGYRPASFGPALLAPLPNRTLTAGANITLAAPFVAKPATVTFQWTKDGSALPAQTNATFTLTNAALADAGSYAVELTNTVSTTISAPATLGINAPPQIPTPPADQTVIVGQPATFTVAATGFPTPTIRWQRNGANLVDGPTISGANTATLTLTPATVNDGGAIRAIASNTLGSATSTAAQLTVNPLAPSLPSTGTAFGIVGRDFTYQVPINTSPVTFAATGLPEGLTINSATGIITGRPTQIGVTAVSVTATNVTRPTAGEGNTMALTVTIAPPPPILNPPPAAYGRAGQPFTFTITAVNMPAGSTYGALGLPAGLELDATTGVISGTPTAAGNYTVALRATNATGEASSPLLLVIAPPLDAPIYRGPANLSAVQGAAFSFAPLFENGITSYAATGLPAGLEINVSTGAITGTPTSTGTSRIQISATNAGGTTNAAVTLTINPAPTAPVVTSASTATATVGSGFSFTLTASGSPTSFSATGLPGTFTLDSTTGVISGTPTAPGTFQAQVRAANAVGSGPQAVLVITVNPAANAPIITSSPVAQGRVGEAFSYTLTASNAPTAFAQTSGTLPPGLTLSGATISGTPTQVGQRRVWFAASNATGQGLGLEILFSIAPANTTPVINSNGTVAGQAGQAFSYAITATNNPTSYALVSGVLPSGLELNASTGVISGIPTEATSAPVIVGLTASNATSTSNVKLVAITIAPAPATPVITSALSAAGRAGNAFIYQITASEGATSYVALNLPPNLVFDPATGVISGTPSNSGTVNVTLRAANPFGLGAPSTLVLALAPAAAAPSMTSAAAASGKVGAATPFSYTATASAPAGSGAVTGFALTGTLPLGMTFNTSTGVLSGQPAESGIFTVQLTATNDGGTSLPLSLVLNIAPADNVPIITSALFASATVGQAFSYQIAAASTPEFPAAPFPAPFSLDAVNLPEGLAVNPSTGLIQGVPTTSGVFTATLVATNAAGASPLRDLTLFVQPAATAPVVTSSPSAAAQVRAPFSYQITATNVPASFEVLGAPAWMTVNGQTGALGGSPTTPGTFTVQLLATNAAGTSNPQSLTVSVAPAPNTPVVTSSRLASGQVGVAFSYTIAATLTPSAFTATGLPAGLSLNATTGVISGTPTASGQFEITLLAANGNGPGQPVTLILAIAPNLTFAP
jgi:uncharacterized delta-60 repeat protein